MAPTKAYRRLLVLHRKKALHQAHLNFIIACLNSSAIPKGLEIKKVPLVAGEPVSRRNLLKKWNNTLRKTSQILLRHLKSYHKSVLVHLKDEIRQEQAILNHRCDYQESLSAIHHYTNKVLQQQNTYKKKQVGETN